MSQSSFQTTGSDQRTLQWVVETGRPMFEATTTVRAEASSMLKPLQGKKNNTHVSHGCVSTCPLEGLVMSEEDVVLWLRRKSFCTVWNLYLEGVMGVRSLPIVWITRRPHTQSPAQMPTPPYSSNQMGVGSFEVTLLDV